MRPHPNQPHGESVFIGLGSNLGDREGFLRSSLERLAGCGKVTVRAVSSLYETEPVGFEDQGPFLNAAAELRAVAEPEEFLRLLLAVEDQIGRRRERRWGPRSIDLDLLLWGQRIIQTESLIVPHPQMACRGFVLAPLAEIASQALHPTLGLRAEQLLANLGPLGGVKVYKEGSGWSGC